jgi:C1A family cysteine protease
MDGKYNYVEKGHHDGVISFPHKVNTLESLPQSVDLRITGKFPPVFDQKSLNSCTANSISAALFFDMNKQEVPDVFTPSRLFIYYNERDLEGKIDNNAPVSMKDCIKTISENGYCAEQAWPYDVQKFDQKPPSNEYDFAKDHKAVKTHKLPFNLDHLKGCLHDGLPFVFGFKVYESFESPETHSTGVVTLPKPNEKKVGGHAVIAIGYDDAKKHIIFRNSFGPSWGDNGHGFMPYDYIASLDKLAFDFWVVQKVADTDNIGGADSERGEPDTKSRDEGLSNNRGCMFGLLSIF